MVADFSIHGPVSGSSNFFHNAEVVKVCVGVCTFNSISSLIMSGRDFVCMHSGSKLVLALWRN